MDNFKKYQKLARRTLTISTKNKTRKELIEDLLLARIGLGISGEAGEIAEKIKKYLRGDISKGQLREIIAPEIGDEQWYLNMLCDSKHGLNLSMDAILEDNIKKLADRKKRKKLKGSGDKR